jgi:FdhD protein
MDSSSPTAFRDIVRNIDGETTEITDTLVVEEPMEIRVRGRSVAVTMRTPGHDLELAAGFLFTEGVVRRRADVLTLHHCLQGPEESRNNILNVFLSPKVELDLESLTRHVFSSSSCGVCGKATIDAVHQSLPALKSPPRFRSSVLAGLPEKLRGHQDLFHQTGGLHAAALFDSAGELLAIREDVGRHNAVDKLIGHGFLEDRLPYSEGILLLSGRASFEIMQKALAAGIPLVAAVSAPSQLAVDFAHRSNQTLVGFLRKHRWNLYAGRFD